MKTCPVCDNKSIKYFNVALHATPVIRKKIICPICDSELETKLNAIVEIFVIQMLGYGVMFVFIFWFFMIQVDIWNLINIKYLGLFVFSLIVRFGVEALVCSLEKDIWHNNQ